MKPKLFNPWHLDSIQPNPRFQQMNKAQLAEAIQYMYSIEYGYDPDEDVCGGTCLFWSYVSCVVLRLAGLRSILQVGSMSWPINPNPIAEATHFSYMWDPTNPKSIERVALGGLPELHCWVALPDQGEIIDFSTNQFRKIAEEKLGLTWLTEDPPNYIWERAEELPKRGILYVPQLEAIKHVFYFLAEYPLPVSVG